MVAIVEQKRSHHAEAVHALGREPDLRGYLVPKVPFDGFDSHLRVGHGHRLLRRIRRIGGLPGSNDVRPVDAALRLQTTACRSRHRPGTG